jgi:glycosyltransferase involved in cell wall biosynthesis
VQVDHITFSQSGGAGQVAKLLVSAQLNLGLDARLLSVLANDLKGQPISQPRITVAAALDQYLVSNHTLPTLISLYRSRLSQLAPGDIRNDSIIHLHWISGLMTHGYVRSLLDEGRKVLWTLHDMAPFTGVCHHAFDCRGYETNCRDCPQVKKLFMNSVEVNLTKKIFDKEERNLLIVAPTQWLAARAKNSLVFRKQKIEVVENPIREGFFLPKISGYAKGGTLNDSRTIGHNLVLTAVASDLQNPAKGIAGLVDVVGYVRARGIPVSLQLVGQRGDIFHDPLNGLFWLGSLSTDELILVAKGSDLLVSASVAESAGLVVREFGAVGVPTLALRAGGISDLIEDGVSGLLVSTFEEMSQALVSFATRGQRLSAWGDRAAQIAELNSSISVAREYAELYAQLGR